MYPAPPLRDIGCFAAVARWLSFSRAARELGLSQPAVSQAVARLEDALELRLFDRTSREVLLTDAGKVLLPYAEALLGQAAAFAAEAARLTEERGHPVRLAYCPLVGTLAARAARRLAHRSPPIELHLRPAGWGAATADLVSGSVGVAIMTTPFPLGFATTTRFHVPVGHVAVPADHPLATAASVAVDQLVRHGLLLAPRGLANQLPGGVRADVDDVTAALDLVAAGSGLLLAPSLLVQSVRRPDVRFVPLDEAQRAGGPRGEVGVRGDDASGRGGGSDGADGVRRGGGSRGEVGVRGEDALGGGGGSRGADGVRGGGGSGGADGVRRGDTGVRGGRGIGGGQGVRGHGGGGLRLTYGLVWRQDNRRPEVTALVQAVQEILRKPFH
ncbi:LysR family transcriptional regulator [Streptosporangiaceae bacterium NEAU-GS5]|nr:LysR family transcriptional regulator [Streptosporangiaceae bacterium NEAU-GS5]